MSDSEASSISIQFAADSPNRSGGQPPPPATISSQKSSALGTRPIRSEGLLNATTNFTDNASMASSMQFVLEDSAHERANESNKKNGGGDDYDEDPPKRGESAESSVAESLQFVPESTAGRGRPSYANPMTSFSRPSGGSFQRVPSMAASEGSSLAFFVEEPSGNNPNSHSKPRKDATSPPRRSVSPPSKGVSEGSISKATMSATNNNNNNNNNGISPINNGAASKKSFVTNRLQSSSLGLTVTKSIAKEASAKAKQANAQLKAKSILEQRQQQLDTSLSEALAKVASGVPKKNKNKSSSDSSSDEKNKMKATQNVGKKQNEGSSSSSSSSDQDDQVGGGGGLRPRARRDFTRAEGVSSNTTKAKENGKVGEREGGASAAAGGVYGASPPRMVSSVGTSSSSTSSSSVGGSSLSFRPVSPSAASVSAQSAAQNKNQAVPSSNAKTSTNPIAASQVNQSNNLISFMDFVREEQEAMKKQAHYSDEDKDEHDGDGSNDKLSPPKPVTTNRPNQLRPPTTIATSAGSLPKKAPPKRFPLPSASSPSKAAAVAAAVSDSNLQQTTAVLTPKGYVKRIVKRPMDPPALSNDTATSTTNAIAAPFTHKSPPSPASPHYLGETSNNLPQPATKSRKDDAEAEGEEKSAENDLTNESESPSAAAARRFLDRVGSSSQRALKVFHQQAASGRSTAEAQQNARLLAPAKKSPSSGDVAIIRGGGEDGDDAEARRDIAPRIPKERLILDHLEDQVTNNDHYSLREPSRKEGKRGGKQSGTDGNEKGKQAVDGGNTSSSETANTNTHTRAFVTHNHRQGGGGGRDSTARANGGNNNNNDNTSDVSSPSSGSNSNDAPKINAAAHGKTSNVNRPSTTSQQHETPSLPRPSGGTDVMKNATTQKNAAATLTIKQKEKRNGSEHHPIDPPALKGMARGSLNTLSSGEQQSVSKAKNPTLTLTTTSSSPAPRAHTASHRGARSGGDLPLPINRSLSFREFSRRAAAASEQSASSSLASETSQHHRARNSVEAEDGRGRTKMNEEKDRYTIKNNNTQEEHRRPSPEALALMRQQRALSATVSAFNKAQKHELVTLMERVSKTKERIFSSVSAGPSAAFAVEEDDYVTTTTTTANDDRKKRPTFSANSGGATLIPSSHDALQGYHYIEIFSGGSGAHNNSKKTNSRRGDDGNDVTDEEVTQTNAATSVNKRLYQEVVPHTNDSKRRRDLSAPPLYDVRGTLEDQSSAKNNINSRTSSGQQGKRSPPFSIGGDGAEDEHYQDSPEMRSGRSAPTKKKGYNDDYTASKALHNGYGHSSNSGGERGGHSSTNLQKDAVNKGNAANSRRALDPLANAARLRNGAVAWDYNYNATDGGRGAGPKSTIKLAIETYERMQQPLVFRRSVPHAAAVSQSFSGDEKRAEGGQRTSLDGRAGEKETKVGKKIVRRRRDEREEEDEEEWFGHYQDAYARGTQLSKHGEDQIHIIRKVQSTRKTSGHPQDPKSKNSGEEGRGAGPVAANKKTRSYSDQHREMQRKMYGKPQEQRPTRYRSVSPASRSEVSDDAASTTSSQPRSLQNPRAVPNNGKSQNAGTKSPPPLCVVVDANNGYSIYPHDSMTIVGGRTKPSHLPTSTSSGRVSVNGRSKSRVDEEDANSISSSSRQSASRLKQRGEGRRRSSSGRSRLTKKDRSANASTPLYNPFFNAALRVASKAFGVYVWSVEDQQKEFVERFYRKWRKEQKENNKLGSKREEKNERTKQQEQQSNAANNEKSHGSSASGFYHFHEQQQQQTGIGPTSTSGRPPPPAIPDDMRPIYFFTRGGTRLTEKQSACFEHQLRILKEVMTKLFYEKHQNNPRGVDKHNNKQKQSSQLVAHDTTKGGSRESAQDTLTACEEEVLRLLRFGCGAGTATDLHAQSYVGGAFDTGTSQAGENQSSSVTVRNAARRTAVLRNAFNLLLRFFEEGGQGGGHQYVAASPGGNSLLTTIGGRRFVAASRVLSPASGAAAASGAADGGSAHNSPVANQCPNSPLLLDPLFSSSPSQNAGSAVSGRSITRSQLEKLVPLLMAEADRGGDSGDEKNDAKSYTYNGSSGKYKENDNEKKKDNTSPLQSSKEKGGTSDHPMLKTHILFSRVSELEDGGETETLHNVIPAAFPLSLTVNIFSKTGEGTKIGGASHSSPSADSSLSPATRPRPFFADFGCQSRSQYRLLCDFAGGVLIPILLSDSYTAYSEWDFSTFSRVLLNSDELKRSRRGRKSKEVRGKMSAASVNKQETAASTGTSAALSHHETDDLYEEYFRALTPSTVKSTSASAQITTATATRISLT